MPNHFHGIVIVEAQFIAPPFAHNNAIPAQELPGGVMNHAPTLGKIIRAFKAVSTRLIRLNLDDKFAWQRDYYEHVIRNEKSLNRIREYILANPLRWELDRENPRAERKDEFDIWLDSFKKAP